jgi:hypothetical protein
MVLSKCLQFTSPWPNFVANFQIQRAFKARKGQAYSHCKELLVERDKVE